MSTTAGPALAGKDATFTEHRGLLFDVAYRMTGSVADAEDLVQDAWLRWSAVDADTVRNPKAYLVRTVTNLALNQLTSARARREQYVGPWLPEPLLTGAAPAGASADTAAGQRSTEQEIEMAESVELAMLVVLETLSPLERAVFLLHDVFGYSHAEIAGIVQRSEAAVRQTARRARTHVTARRPRFDSDDRVRLDAAHRFRAACLGGDLNAMLELLAPDVTVWSDGGGKVTAARRPVHGADRVSRWILGIFAKPAATATTSEIAWVNDAPALVASVGGQVIAVVSLDVVDGRISAVRVVVNPDKLSGVQPSRRPGAAPGQDSAGLLGERFDQFRAIVRGPVDRRGHLEDLE